jgi:hypothetical protein
VLDEPQAVGVIGQISDAACPIGVPASDVPSVAVPDVVVEPGRAVDALRGAIAASRVCAIGEGHRASLTVVANECRRPSSDRPRTRLADKGKPAGIVPSRLLRSSSPR